MAFAVCSMMLGGASAADVYADITTEALRPNDSAEGRPLPLASHWTTGVSKAAAGWRPQWQMSQIAAGHHLIPWFQLPQPMHLDEFEKTLDFGDYARDAIREACARRLPFVLIATQWESLLTRQPYQTLPPDQNPNVVGPDGAVRQPTTISPFGPIAPWSSVGLTWTTSPPMHQIQDWCPNPVMVLFLSNNEAVKLDWSQVESDARYVKLHGAGRSDDFKREAVGDAWTAHYRALQAGMRAGLANPTWQANARFIGYNAFGPPHFGRWWGWKDYSLYHPGRMDPAPLAWDGGSPSYYVMNSTPETDYTAWSPQNEFQNLVFMQEEARTLNPQFWFELSVWDGYVPGGDASKNGAGSDNRAYFATIGQRYSPARYKGFVQFGMWLNRPRVVREFRDWLQPRNGETEPYFTALMDAVDAVFRNDTLKSYWRRGRLLPAPGYRHPYQSEIPPEYATKPRWFILDADANGFAPPGMSTKPAESTAEIRVFSIALELGSAPNRSWLIYAASPLQDRAGTRISIPGYDRRVTLPLVSVSGSFYEALESSGTVRDLNPSLRYQ